MGQGRARADAGHHLTSIAVVTIAWRNEGHAAAFADSLDADQRIVVVNGPEGEAAAALVPHAELVRLDTNTGFSGGANAGAARASGDIVVVANLDVTFDPQFFAVLRREADQPWDFLAPRVLQGPDGRDEGVARRTRSHRLAWVTPPPSQPGPVPAGNGACLIMRRATLDRRTVELGALFDPEYHSFNEDIDLFWWAARRGLTVRYVPDLQVRHAKAGSFEGRDRFRDRPADVQRRVIANYRVTVWKNARSLDDWLGWSLGEAVYAGQAVVYGRLAGLGTYAASWPDSIRAAAAIRRRRGRLRPQSTSPE